MTVKEFFENTSGVESVNIYDKSNDGNCICTTYLWSNYDKNIAIEKCGSHKIAAMSFECDSEQSIYADLEIE